MAHTIMTSWNTIASTGLCESADKDFSIRLVHEMQEGPTAYRIEIEHVDGTWHPYGETLHLTGQQIAEAEGGGLLRQLMGVAEVSRALGIDKRELAVMIQRGQFIRPATTLDATPIWLRPDVMKWRGSKGKIEAKGEDKDKEKKNAKEDDDK